jgi:hypothetical protein
VDASTVSHHPTDPALPLFDALKAAETGINDFGPYWNTAALVESPQTLLRGDGSLATVASVDAIERSVQQLARTLDRARPALTSTFGGSPTGRIAYFWDFPRIRNTM